MFTLHPLRPCWPFFQALRAGVAGPTPGTRLRPLLWQLRGSWLREVPLLRLWRVRGLIIAHGPSGQGPPP